MKTSSSFAFPICGEIDNQQTMRRNPVNCEPTVVNQKISPQVQKNNTMASHN